MNNKVLFICPISGNGGIQSWTKKMLATFPNEEYSLCHINVSHRRSTNKSKSRLKREIDGLIDMFTVSMKVWNAVRNQSFAIMHTTTSGNIGTLRDYLLVKICHRKGIKCIMHCRYGCISEDFVANGFWGRLLRKTLHLYDNVWVLDKRSEYALKQDPDLEKKVKLTPNSIIVPDNCDLSPKQYKQVAFVGNLVPSKGLYELVHAVADHDIDVNLTIAGPGNLSVLEEIERIAGKKWNKSIRYVGKLNQEKQKLMNKLSQDYANDHGW